MDYYTSSSDLATGLFAGAMIFVAVVIIIAAIIVLLQIIGLWKILKKADQPGWGALIPIYNQYLLCKIVGVSPWWILILCLSPILVLIPIIGSLATMAATIYFTILLNVSLARSFGKEDGFAVGLILLTPIFYLILGLGDSKYLGEKPMSDVVFNKINQVNNNNNNTSNNKTEPATPSSEDINIKYCTSCGSKIDEYTRFCPNCGKEVE